MAAPTLVGRVTPTGQRLRDGFPITIALGSVPAAGLWEISVQPPGVSGGDPVPTTTQWNQVWRTMAARQLKTLTPCTSTVAYDPAYITVLAGVVNVEDAITIHFPDNSALTFWGYLGDFQPQQVGEGQQPLATITVVPTNTDPSDGSEAAPIYTASAGTPNRGH